MRRVLLGVAVAAGVGCSSSGQESLGSTEHADTASAVSMIACPSDGSDANCPVGSFRVTCKDGSKEVATVAQIQHDQICLPPPAPPPPSNDPFDPGSCSGPAMTKAQAAALFAPGASDTIIGSYVVQKRSRTCNAVTGCGAWSPSTTLLGSSLGSMSADLEMKGDIHLKVQSNDIVLQLGQGMVSLAWDGAQCGTVSGGIQSCSSYSYIIGWQWGGSGGEYPTEGALLKADNQNVTLTGVLTPTCLRLSDSATTPTSEEQYVVLANLTTPSTPPTPACPAGETQMACGSQAASGMTTCCQMGTTTCPQSGCDCWSACQ